MSYEFTSENAKKLFQPGTRIELVKISEPFTKMESGEKGTVVGVEGTTILVCWDNGVYLDVEYGIDKVKIISE